MNFNASIAKLQVALNNNGTYKVLYNRNQFYSEEKHRPITMYIIKMSRYNSKKDKDEFVEVFKTGSQLHCVLFLRNLYYTVTGQEIPKSQFQEFEDKWENFKLEYLGNTSLHKVNTK